MLLTFTTFANADDGDYIRLTLLDENGNYDRQFFSNETMTDANGNIVPQVGIYQGGSLQMWKEYFGNESNIYGVDINPNTAILRDDGFEILAFPSNDFFGEQSREDEIHKFCTFNYGVTFPLFAKVHVQGEETHPLFRLLVEHSRHGGSVKWNFSKFLIDRKGELQDRFAPFTKPTADRVVKVIERFLDQHPETI